MLCTSHYACRVSTPSRMFWYTLQMSAVTVPRAVPALPGPMVPAHLLMSTLTGEFSVAV
jgi:hypothetical protein